MARTTQPRASRADPVEVEDVEADPRTEAEADDLNVMMASLAGAASSNITVYRMVKGSKPAYVFSCTPDAFSLDVLRDKYNGGEFRLYITKEGVLWKNKIISVEPKQLADNVEAPTAIAELAAAMRDGLARQAEAVREVALRASAQSSGAAPSPLSNLDIPAIITAIAAAVTAFRPPPAPPAPPAPASDSAQSIDLFIRGLELGREIRQDGGGGEPTLMGMLGEVIKSPMLAQAVAATVRPAPTPQRPHPQQQIPQRVPIQPQPQPAPAPATPAASFASEKAPPMNAAVVGYLSLLCTRAEAGSDPALYADLVLDNIDDETLGAVINGVPTPVDFLASFHQPVLMHREWFERLLSVLVEALDADSNNGAQSGELSSPVHSNAIDSSTPDIPG